MIAPELKILQQIARDVKRIRELLQQAPDAEARRNELVRIFNNMEVKKPVIVRGDTNPPRPKDGRFSLKETKND